VSVDPDAFYVIKTLTERKDALEAENALLKARVSGMQQYMEQMPDYRRRIRHLEKLLRRANQTGDKP
jgi:hypothetical protein